jgi:hypothetical protein
MTKEVAFDSYPQLRKLIAEAENVKNIAIQADNLPNDNQEATFGVNFPIDVKPGHMHIHTGLLPSKLYKFNGNQWIEVDKKISDSYTHNVAYIQYLIKRLESREVTFEDLTPGEQSLVKEHFNK